MFGCIDKRKFKTPFLYIRCKIQPPEKFATKSVAKFLTVKILQQEIQIMKNKTTIRTLLGLSQQDMAVLLGVTRGHLSMYEIGKRDLPSHAMLLLAEMLAYVQAPEAAERRTEAAKQYSKPHQQFIERMIRENEFQQLRIARKIAAEQKKQESQLRMVHLSDFLNNRQAKEKTANVFHDRIIHKAQVAARETNTSLLKFELEQELLILEKMMLESKLRKIELGPGDNGDEGK
jgi:transcriptional regulator with XRE-family HTH domain